MPRLGAFDCGKHDLGLHTEMVVLGNRAAGYAGI